MKTRRTFLKLVAGVVPLAFIPKLSFADTQEDDWVENPRWKDPKFRSERLNNHWKTVWSGPFHTHIKEYEPGWERYLGRKFVVYRSFEMICNLYDANMTIMAWPMANHKTKKVAIEFANRFKE